MMTPKEARASDSAKRGRYLNEKLSFEAKQRLLMAGDRERFSAKSVPARSGPLVRGRHGR